MTAALTPLLDVAFAAADPAPTSGSVALPLAEEDLSEGAATPGSAALAAWDAALGGAVSRAARAAEFRGRKGQSATLLALGGDLARVVLLGLGKREALDATAAEATGGAAAAALASEAGAATLDARPLGSATLAADAATGAVLRRYRFDRYRTTEKPDEKPKLAALRVLADDPDAARAAFAPRRAVAEGVFFARDLVSEPANVLHPEEFADRLTRLEKLGVEVEVFGPKDLRKLNFGAMLGVAQGSAREPRMVVMRWNGAGKRSTAKPLCFVGKGVTFDTGGISIKPAAGMEDMKWDMAGAGAVAGLMHALAARKARANVVGVVGLVENMPSGTAQRPGDVVTTASGQTVEVINTDAEGRLVLADVMWHAKRTHDPAFMVDLATLTGAIIIALGHEHTGMFANDDGLAARIEAAGKATGELVWRMPLGEAYDKQLKSDVADMKNVGGRPGGSITAAQFIARFVDGCPWAHLDIAGTAWTTKDGPVTPKGATAWGVRLLDRMVADHHEAGASEEDAAAEAPVPTSSEPKPKPSKKAKAALVSGSGTSEAVLAEGTASSAPATPAQDAGSTGGTASSSAPKVRIRKR